MSQAEQTADIERCVPRNRRELIRWLKTHLSVDFSTGPGGAGAEAPIGYLSHSFFEGSGSFSSTPREELGRDSIVWAGRGAGKTFLGAVATLLDMVYKPGIEIRILAGSLEQSRRMYAHLRRLFARETFAPLVDGRAGEKRFKLTNNSAVEVLAQSQTSVRGTRIHKLRCDEVELFQPEIWDAAQLVTVSAPFRVAGFGDVHAGGTIDCLSTMHIPHGLMQRLVDEARDGRRTLFRWGVSDVLEHCRDSNECVEEEEEGGKERECPLGAECAGEAKVRVRRGHVRVSDAISMKRRVAVATWRSEMLCHRPSRSTAAVPEFAIEKHVVDETPPASELSLVAGMDFGICSPTVILWGGIDRAGVLWILDERSVAGEVLRAHVEALEQHELGRPEWIGVDPAGEQLNAHTGESTVDMMRRRGFKTRHKKMRLLAGLRLIRARLDPATCDGSRLYIHRRCTRLIESLERYRFKDPPVENSLPLKDGSDHAVDALRYLVAVLDCRHSVEMGRYVA